MATDEHKQNAKIKSSATTQLVSEIVLSDGRTISYEYDEEERITKVTDSVDGVTEYTYDALGQLVTEAVNDTVVNQMTYDNYGNIRTKNDIEYTYDGDWKDKLISYNGQSITYDAQGNPISYLGHTLTWEKGRQLKSFVKTDGTVIEYTYNANGIRTSKTVNGVLHTYTLDGTKILRETWGDNTLVPLYDNEDSVCGIIYNQAPYYFLKNLQGDIIAIVDKDAQTVAKYSYDAWGVCTVTQDTSGCNIAHINPFRYRGYFFDEGTGLYYLQSRYYNAEVGRFVNGDSAEVLTIGVNILIHNLFIFCVNDPIDDVDATGYLSLKTKFKSISKYIKIGLGKLSIKLSRILTIILGVLTVLYRLGNICKDIKKIHKVTNSKIATAITAALPYGTSQVASEILAFFCKASVIVGIMSAITSFITMCCMGGTFKIASTILSLIISYFVPSIICGIQMIYYGWKKIKVAHIL